MANDIRIGSATQDAAYVGSSAVSKMFLGSNQVWPAGGDSGRPVQVASYGPNGTHWPSTLLFPTESFGTDITIDCSWANINSTVAGLTAQQVSGNVIIRVRDGTLAGSGAGAASTSPVDGLGDSAWTKQVLIVPESGYGGVVITASVAYANVDNIAIAGFKYDNCNFAIRLSNNLSILWSKVNCWSITGGASNIGLYEIASGYSRPYQLGLADYDTNAIRPAGTGTIVGIHRIGCHAGPTRLEQIDQDYHMDALQFERTDGDAQRYGDLFIEDCFDVAASNAVYVLRSSADNIVFRHTWGIGGKISYLMDPPTGDDYDANDTEAGPNCFSGGAVNVQIYDSNFIGSYGSIDYSVGSNTRWNNAPSNQSQNPTTGSWTIDTSMNDMTLADFLAIAPKPTEAQCETWWASRW